MLLSQTLKQRALALAMLCGVLFLPSQAAAIKYMSTKEAIKNFLPEGATLSKVEKSIPADKIEAIKKRFSLTETADFKEKLSPGPYTIYIGRGSDGKAQVYILILEQYWRTCYHKYAVGLSADGSVKELAVVEFNCKFQYPTNKKSFLNQFKGKKVSKGGPVPAHIFKDIDVVTGATMSSDAAAIIIRRALALYELFFAS